MLPGLAEPEQDGAQNEDHSRRDADDDGPGKAGRQNRRDRREWRLWVRQNSKEGTAEAVAHGIGPKADVHASVLLLGSSDK